MELSARDIHEKEFHDAWRGYNQEEVDDFLDRVAESVERLRRENEMLHARIRELDQAVAASRDTEEMLKKTLVTAQRAAEEAIARAKAKAEELISEADSRARRTEEDAHKRIAEADEDARRKASEIERDLARRRRELDERIEKLRAFERDAHLRLKTFFEQQLKTLDALGAVEPPKFEPPSRPPPDTTRLQTTPRAGDTGGLDVEQQRDEAADDPSRRGVRDLFFRQGGER
ncbi:MAG TPA: DivIVA domain-containing protein [Actinomycetota bacterium]|nr:DivIVA domain-containing protein [Actinomycetota bacterium]